MLTCYNIYRARPAGMVAVVSSVIAQDKFVGLWRGLVPVSVLPLCQDNTSYMRMLIIFGTLQQIFLIVKKLYNGQHMSYLSDIFNVVGIRPSTLTWS